MNKHRFTLQGGTGFTLLEVILFLAVSGALAVIALIGLGPRLRNVRFTQSVRTAEAAINREFYASSFGTNTRPENFECRVAGDELEIGPSSGADPVVTGGSEACVINGVLAVFGPTGMSFYSIVSRRQPYLAAGATAEECDAPADVTTLLNCYTPRVAGGANQPPVPRTNGFQNAVTAQSSLENNGKPLAFGTIQNPNGTQKFQFFYTDAEIPFVPTQIVSSDVKTAVLNPYACLELGGRSAKISFTSGSVKPTVTFEECSV